MPGSSLGVRGKIFLISVAGIALALVVGGGWLERDLRRDLEEHIQVRLQHTVSGSRVSIERVPQDAAVAETESLAQQLGRAFEARITFITAGGQVIGDSEVGRDDVDRMSNHAQRPEVVSALSSGSGVARRRSATLGAEMLYLAAPYGGHPPRGVVRAALSLKQVDGAVHKLRMRLLTTAAIALVFAGFMSWLAAQWVRSMLGDLLSVARDMASGSSRRRAPASSSAEFDGLAGSLNRMAGALEETVADLARERDKSRAVLESMADAVLALDAAEVITVCNEAAVKMLALPSRPVGMSLLEAARLPALHEVFEHVRMSGSKPVELTLRGTTRVLVRAETLREPEGGVVMVLRDVTELRRLESIRRDFVANVSHELRTPVSTIQSSAEALLAGAMHDKDHGDRFLRAVLRNAERLGRIISDLLDLSRIEAGELSFDMQPISIRAAAQRAREALDEKARTRSVSVEVDVDASQVAFADDSALEHVLVNLIDNAVKYTPEHGHVAVRAVPREDGIRVEVADDGPGVEPRFRERIFERFYRVDPGRSRELGGTGLGLSIVKHLVEAMGGSVGVEGGPQGGSTFWFVLRAARPSTTPEA